MNLKDCWVNISSAIYISFFPRLELLNTELLCMLLFVHVWGKLRWKYFEISLKRKEN